MTAAQSEDCPYVGLEPYTDRHARYFFGRTLDSQVIADNALTRPTTVLYGRSGVGKSSVLNVGLPAALTREGISTTLIRWGSWHESSGLMAAVDTAIAKASRNPKWPLVIILDQFEEYFLYRSPSVADGFERALAEVLSRRDLRCRLLFSLRDDGLHLLDSLRLRLPSILDNTLELKHLDEVAVREAITEPVHVYNQRKGEARRVHLDEGFAGDLLRGLRGSQPEDTLPRPAQPEQAPIALPFLQLVLRRLWDTMPRRGERVLDIKLLKKNDEVLEQSDEPAGDDGDGPDEDRELRELTHGVRRIVKSHVYGKLDALSLGDRQLACDVFHYLVTPSGGKFAYKPEDLAALASETSRREIDRGDVAWLLSQLSDGTARLLRRAGDRFELFHDVLARPILDWRAAYLQTAPFGFLTEVVTGEVFSLGGDGCLFGRLWDYQKTTRLSLRPVSRNHFLIFRTGQILDLRSRFGTTVNAEPLRFGQTDIFLKSGDLICLANTAALIFHSVEDAPPAEGKRSVDRKLGEGWGLLIDGGTRSITSLSCPTLYLALNGDDVLAASTDPLPGSFAALHRNEAREVRITALAAEPMLTVMERADSFHNREWNLPLHHDFVVDLRSIKERRPESFSDVEGAERGVFRFGDRYFEIIVL